jgi:D-amino-acid dehydrogenase
MGRAVVVGAGAVGVATAAFLQRDGWSVTVVDREEPGRGGASFGNAGLIATHIVEPIAVRSILPRLPRMLLDPTAPLAIRWWYLPQLMPWLVRLLRATAPAEVERISAALASELAHADAAWRALVADAEAEALVKRVGVLMVYPDRAYLDANAGYQLELRRRNGVPFEIVGDNALRNLAPELSRDYQVGVLYTAASSRGAARSTARTRPGSTSRATASSPCAPIPARCRPISSWSPRESGRASWRACSARACRSNPSAATTSCSPNRG